ncbi:hypothetical protein QYE76_036355 [Lolium multiflorum]|uniref:Aminotransferase-like plant mobile domain-containing protein n=1 Tax=Lolium multiflorum TaxID=4521 RepID=A0AAD8R1U1_LOLMU|nr:hypothetical protein QYE76_036355 [Lolium multiflorum]
MRTAPHIHTDVARSTLLALTSRRGRDVWRRSHGGVIPKGATHPLKCGARARPSPTLFFLPSSLFSVSRGLPKMKAATLTALVDRWRPETHTFHLRTGEMTPTLQDVSVILGLPIHGEALCMNTASDG